TMLMGLSVRIFGLSSWSVLLPEALCGVATVIVLFAIVRRQFGTVAATIAAVVMAITPAAVLIFRYNNPDALLTLLLVLAAGAFLRGLENGRLRWVVIAAALVGFAFNTKYLQAYLVLPAFIVTHAICAPGSLRRRGAGLVAAALAVVVSSGWWVLAIELIPAANRPYIGGSTNNSALQLLLGYDGLGRIFGGPGPAGGGGPGGGGGAGAGGGGFGGAAGLLRMFNAQFGGQIAWLLPFSAVGLVTGLAMRWRAARTDPARAAYLMWGLWLAVHVVVFSLMSGIIHSYYAVAMAPAIGALVGAGTVDLWRLRARWRLGGLPLAAAIAVSAVVAWQLLLRTPAFMPGLALAVLVIGLLAAAAVAVPLLAARRIHLTAAAIGLVVLLTGPAAYAMDTMNTAYSGGDPAAGPAAQETGFGARGSQDGLPGTRPGSAPGDGVRPPSGGVPGGGFAGGGPAGEGSADPALVSYLLANQGGATWIVATSSSHGAGSIELASGKPVMAMGGFMGSDPAPTLDQLKALVASGQLRFLLLGGGGRGPGGSSSTDIDAWVVSVGTVVSYGGNGGTLYDLSGASRQ
ncbi:MAG: hypothetical protein QOH61_2861, partial [Chloroflexota bacterium]|nr:hypothetical protein [Chloroflexota bacterium]